MHEQTGGVRRQILTETVVGTFLGLGHPGVAEILAWSGWDLICIDSEHSALGPGRSRG